MIKFIMPGGIGWKNENGVVELKVAGDIVSGSKEVEAKLVSEGRAEYVKTESAKEEQPKTAEKSKKSDKKQKEVKAEEIQTEEIAEEEPPVLTAAEPE